MDSFSIFFPVEVSSNELVQAIALTGSESLHTSGQEIAVSRGAAQLWLDIKKLNELPVYELDRAAEWPIRGEQVLSVVGILVRRNEESDELALEVAHELARRLGGAISWDGMDYWEDLYNRRKFRDSDHDSGVKGDSGDSGDSGRSP